MGTPAGASISSWEGVGGHTFLTGHEMLAAMMTAHPDAQISV